MALWVKCTEKQRRNQKWRIQTCVKAFVEIEKLSEEGSLFPQTIKQQHRENIEIIPFTRVLHVTVGLTLLTMEHAQNLIATRMLLFCAIYKGHRPGFVEIFFYSYVQTIELEMIVR